MGFFATFKPEPRILVSFQVQNQAEVEIKTKVEVENEDLHCF